MKPIKTLIKLHKKQLDDLLAEINKLEGYKSQTILKLKKLEQELEKELSSYLSSEYSFMLEQYTKISLKNKKSLQEQIIQSDEQILLLREKLQDQFAELKKFEIALENRLNNIKEQEKRKEDKLLDEHNIIKFANKKTI